MQPLAFIILSYNSFSDAVRLCGEILALPGSENCRVILVDNCSPSRNGYPAWLELKDPRVLRIEASSNGGYGSGNNLGIDCALALGIERVVLLNPDVYLPHNQDWIARIQQAFDEESFLVMGFTVEGILPYHSQGLGPVVLPVLYRLLDARRQQQLVRSGALGAYFRVGRVYGCAFALHARTFRSLGLFDPKMFMYWEESVVSYIAACKGERVLQARDIQVRHAVMGSSTGSLSTRHLGWMRSSLRHYLHAHRKLPWVLTHAVAWLNSGQILLSYLLRAIFRSARRLR